MQNCVYFSLINKGKLIFNVSVDLDESLVFDDFVKQVFHHFRMNPDNPLVEFLTFISKFNYTPVSVYVPVFSIEPLSDDLTSLKKIEYELDTSVVRYGQDNVITSQSVHTMY